MNGLEPFVSFGNFEKKVLIDRTHECVTGAGHNTQFISKDNPSPYPYKFKVFLHNEPPFDFTYDSKGHQGGGYVDLFLRPLISLPYVIDPATGKKVEDAIYVPVGKAVVLYGDGIDDIVVVRSRSNNGNLMVIKGNTGYELVKPPQPEKTFHGLNKQDLINVVSELISPIEGACISVDPVIDTQRVVVIDCVCPRWSAKGEAHIWDNGLIEVFVGPKMSMLELNLIGAYKLLTSKWVD